MMFCYIYYNDSWFDAICPFCNFIPKRQSHTLQFYDYVDKPMIWCDGCKARAVLNTTVEFIAFLENKCQ